MYDMYVHQYTKEEPNWSSDGTVISTSIAHTHSPLFLLQISQFPEIFLLYILYFVYLSKYISLHFRGMGQTQFLKFTDIISPICMH